MTPTSRPKIKDYNVKEYLKHFKKNLSENFLKYVDTVALRHSRYIFTEKLGKEQSGHCTHCGASFPTPKLKHNSIYHCPICRSMCTVKSSGMHRKNLYDEAYVVFFEKSEADPNTMVALGAYFLRDYSGDFHDVKTKHKALTWYVFEPGNPVMLMQNYNNEFYKCRSVYSYFNHEFLSNLNVKNLCSINSVRMAARLTPFQYSAFEEYSRDDSEDMVEYFALYSRYPTVEYLMKLGFKELVETKLMNGRTYSAINWRGKNLFQVLKVTKSDLKEIKEQKISPSFLFLKLLQISKADGSKLTLTQLSNMAESFDTTFKELQEVLKYTNLGKAYSYITKQANVIKTSKWNIYNLLITWKDYISDCIQLGWDISNESVLYPKNVSDAHQNTIRQLKIIANKELDKKVQKRLPSLNKKYSLHYKDLFIRPAESTIELIDEGKTLSHCVGTYGDRYAKGETIILLIRRAEDPDKPFFTMEVRNNSIIQVRGLRNCAPDKTVEEFVNVFKVEKLEKKSKGEGIPA